MTFFLPVSIHAIEVPSCSAAIGAAGSGNGDAGVSAAATTASATFVPEGRILSPEFVLGSSWS